MGREAWCAAVLASQRVGQDWAADARLMLSIFSAFPVWYKIVRNAVSPNYSLTSQEILNSWYFLFHMNSLEQMFACANKIAIMMQRSVLKEKTNVRPLSTSAKYCSNCKQSLKLFLLFYDIFYGFFFFLLGECSTEIEKTIFYCCWMVCFMLIRSWWLCCSDVFA